MSILGAVVVGGGLGLAGQNFIFNYTKDVYEAKVNELTNLIARLQNHLSELENLKSEIPSFWDDDNARKSNQAITVTMERTKDAMDVAQRLLDNFKETINNLDNSQNTLGGFIEDALGILGGLK